jgi:diguanylate cyclase (GGDEF)-like protein
MSFLASLYNIKNPARALSWAYILAFSVIAMFTLAGHGTTFYIMKKQAESTEVTYHISRLRGLVQRIPYHIINYKQHVSEVDRMILLQAIKEVEASHEFLTEKVGKNETISPRLSEIYFRSRFEINDNMALFLDKISLCSNEDHQYGQPAEVCEQASQNLNAGLLTALTGGFDVALEGYREETIRKIDSYHRLQVIGTLIILLVLLLEGALIFRPLIHKITVYHRLLLKQALEDPLTKLRNRRAFVRSATGELRQAARDKESVSVVLMDLDKFKLVNDNYGHDVGDSVLKHFSKMLRKHLRGGDIIGRIGGEEFAVVLPRETGKDLAFQVLDRMRALVADTPCPYNDKSGKLCYLNYSVSIGVVSLVPVGETIEELLARADEMLYKAKETGRNKVVAEE